VVARIDSAILHEIARIVQTRSKVPDRLRLMNREFQITYLEDHRQRMEDALRRHDAHLLNMLFGQLASKVKYQQLRTVKGQAGNNGSGLIAPPRRAGTAAKGTAPAVQRPARKASAKQATAKKMTSKTAVVKKSAGPGKRTGASHKRAAGNRKAVGKQSVSRRKK
jgi:hypothetical protein